MNCEFYKSCSHFENERIKCTLFRGLFCKYYTIQQRIKANSLYENQGTDRRSGSLDERIERLRKLGGYYR